ncbi:hypothetical protein ABFA07_018874 [Porites harrisoni]
MDRDDVDTKNMEIELLNQVEKYLQNVAGFISVELDRFSLPLGDESTGRIRDKSVGMIAEVNIYCVENSKAKILKQLEESLTKQGNISALIGKTLRQVLFRTDLRAPDDTIRLPAGDHLHDYTFRLNVEAHFSALQSLHSYVFVKVIIPTGEDISSKLWTLGDLINKDSYSLSFLIAQIEDWRLDKLSKTKVK